MSIFDGGPLLLKNLLQSDFVGLTGPFKFSPDKSLIRPAYDIINVIGTGFRRVGYWSNYSGLSIFPPETFYSKPPNRSSSSQKLYSVVWPGNNVQKPRGWVFPNNGKQLRIGVPIRVSYREFVSQIQGTNNFKGFCIDVFTAAVNLLPYAVPHQFVPYGNGHENPSYTDMVKLITAGPYVASGLVVVAPFQKLNSGGWAFLIPFSAQMWGVITIFFLFVGMVVWILEHRINDEFRGPPKQQLITILWFSLSTLFFAQREYCKYAWSHGADHMALCGFDNKFKLHSNANSGFVGQEFTKSGWGFAFPRDSPLAVDLSTAILTLSENGDLQRIHDKWLARSACSLDNAELESDRLHLRSFSGLFLICGIACVIALLIYFLQILRKFHRTSNAEVVLDGQTTSRSKRLQTLLSLIDEKSDKSNRGSKRRKIDRSISDDNIENDLGRDSRWRERESQVYS
ncbi:hypothetical protein K7X08_001701 [Anisodus acutangulus]|uniref:Ionotropic glutamate receptor C-terminal domain-containing protein n=1 Tax=Anisodus acutangulus TaxID=402998 RepID=A0A9Q1LRL0_9SOLA|nr:hypothetical protein K7X08_001701 [Anisodus acutangulus]